MNKNKEMKERFYLKTKQEIKNMINNKINYISTSLKHWKYITVCYI